MIDALIGLLNFLYWKSSTFTLPVFFKYMYVNLVFRLPLPIILCPLAPIN